MAPPAVQLSDDGPALPPLDATRLREALALAEGSIGLSEPNPRVGCVLGFDDGRVIGRGFTQEAGGAHAEVMALRDAAALGQDTRDATAWVTLEPCAHHGRTPPCCDALIAAGIARVVVAVGDPFPAVAGRGLERLRAAGIRVDFGDASIEAAAREINIGFFSRMERGRPWVRAKIAASIDGFTALPDGRSQWITGEAARTDGHAWRSRAGAILTGSGTVLADDPRLDVRLVPTAKQPMRVVIDGQLRCAPTSRVFAPPGRTVVLTTDEGLQAASSLRDMGVSVVALPGPVLQASGARQVDLAAAMDWLAGQQVNELHVEAGATLLGTLLQARLVDELLVYMAPIWLGQGTPMAHLPALADLSHPRPWHWVDHHRVGTDMRMRLRRGAPAPSEQLTLVSRMRAT
jgi:diaminohydroxyphosphoribosylaminopyrimidine deaminase/5-amino-6-(5-phosphoribosylamino)uracil reductase